MCRLCAVFDVTALMTLRLLRAPSDSESENRWHRIFKGILPYSFFVCRENHDIPASAYQWLTCQQIVLSDYVTRVCLALQSSSKILATAPNQGIDTVSRTIWRTHNRDSVLNSARRMVSALSRSIYPQRSTCTLLPFRHSGALLFVHMPLRPRT